MRPNSVIDYRGTGHPRKPWPTSAWVLVSLTAVLAALWAAALFPYDPPRDWSTFLGAPEEELVHVLIKITMVPWSIAVVALVHALWHGRRAA